MTVSGRGEQHGQEPGGERDSDCLGTEGNLQYMFWARGGGEGNRGGEAEEEQKKFGFDPEVNKEPVEGFS